MPLELRPMVKEDAQEAVALLIASYANNPFRAIILPNGMTQNTIDKMIKARQTAIDDPNKHVLKVVDTDNNDKIAGCAVWEYTKAMSDKDWEHAREGATSVHPEARHDILDEILLKEEDLKRRIMGRTRWLELYALNTLPSYQRRGVGAMLVKWGTDIIEEMKVPGFIIATDQGYGLYLKHGFREVDRWEVDMSQWPPAHGTYMNVFLTRMPSS